MRNFKKRGYNLYISIFHESRKNSKIIGIKIVNLKLRDIEISQSQKDIQDFKSAKKILL